MEGGGEDGRESSFHYCFYYCLRRTGIFGKLWCAFMARLLLLPLLAGFVIHYSVATQAFFFPLLLSFSAHLPAPARAFYMTGTRIRYVVPWMSIACCTSTKAPSILISCLSLSFRSLPILFVPFFFFCRACRWRCSSTWIASRIDIYIYKQQACEKYRTPLLRDFSDVPTRKDHPLVVDTLTNGNW